jgi:hypothetical protein
MIRHGDITGNKADPVYLIDNKEVLGLFPFDAGTGYTVPAPIASDTRAEFAPAVAFDGQGKVVAVWERVGDTDFAGADIGDMAAELEIVYAVYDPSTAVWTEPVELTRRYLPDAMVPSNHDFSHVDANTASDPVRFTFANIISADVMMGEIAITGPGGSDFVLNNDACSGKTLATGQSCGLDVVFSPATLGYRSAFITIRSGDPADSGKILAEIPLYGGRVIARGDVDADGVVLMTDALLVLKQLAGQPAQNIYSAAAVDPDEKIGPKESIFILQQASGSRESEGQGF